MAAATTSITGGGTFTLSSGATLGITSTTGITTAGTASGNIQTTSRTFDAGANYIYNGTANQAMGTGFPTNLTGDLIINNPGFTVTLGNTRTIASGGLIDLRAGTFAAASTLSMASTSSITRSAGSMTGTLQGTGVYNVEYTGSSKTTGPELSGSGLNNVTLNLTSGQTLTLGAAVTIDGALANSSGNTLDVSASNFAINLAGNWTNSGTFTPQGGTVTLNGTSQSISGNTTFYNLTKSVATAATLTFAASSTQTVTGTLTLSGAAGQLLTLASSSPGTQWNINPTGRSVSYVSVSYSNNTNATAISPTNSTNGGNNTNWSFSLATKLVFTTSAVTVTAGVASGTITVQRQNASGTPVTADPTISVALSSTSTGTVTFAPVSPLSIPLGSSSVSFTYTDTKAGTPTITAQSASLTNGTQVETVNAAAAAKLAFTTQPGGGTGGIAWATQPVVTVQDAYDNTVTTDVSTVTVAIQNNAGPGGVLSGTTTKTAVAGVASFSANALAIDKIGTGYTLVATDGSLTSTISSPFNITLGAAAKLAFTTQPGGGTGGTAWATQPVVTIQDAGGNTVTGNTSTVTLGIQNNAGPGGVLSGTLTKAAVSGVASFSGNALKIDKIGTGYTLIATDGILTSSVSSAFNITVGAATKLAFTTQPGGGTSGTAWATQPVVTVQDAGGNTVTTATNSITLAIGTNPPGTGVLSVTTNPLAASGGIATFSGANIDKSGTGYTLTAAASGLTGATSSTFNITAGALDHFVMSSISSPQVTGTAFSITITAQDANNNTVTGYTGTVNMTTTAGTVSPATSNSFAAGTLTQNFSVSLAGTGMTITATRSSGGSETVTSNTFNVLQGEAATDFFRSRATGNWNATGTWERSTDGTAGTWSNAVSLIPTSAAASVTIQTYTVTVTANATSGDLIANSGSLILNTGVTLTVTGDVSGSGTLTGSGTSPGSVISLDGSYSFSGAITTSNRTSLTFTGGNDQTISGTVTWRNIVVVKTGGTLFVTKSLSIGTTTTLTSGNINYSGGAQNILGATHPGDLTTSGSGIKTVSSSITIGGNLIIGDNTNFSIGASTTTVTGSTTIGDGTSGTLTISSATGTKVFTGLVTINSGGTWNNSANSPVNFRGGITNNGTFTCGSGSQTFTNNAQALNGILSIPNPTINSITVTNNGTLTVGTALAGTGGLTNTGTLNIGGTSAITTLTANATVNTVNYTGAAQTVFATTYHHLTLSGSGAKTISTAASGTLTNGIFNIDRSSGQTPTASVTNNAIKVNELRFSGVTQGAGTWGYGPANPPLNQDQVFFANTTGYLDALTGSLDHFAISTITSPQIAGTAIAGITLTARDFNNNTVTDFASTVTYGGTAGISGTSASFTSGQLTGVSVTPTVVGSGLTFTVTASGKTGTSNTFDVNAGGKTSANNGDWNTSGTWSDNIVPISTDNVTIANAVTLAGNANCNNLTISGGTLTIASGASLITKGTVTGSAIVNRAIVGGEWHLISSPVSDAMTIATFSGKYLQKHTESTNAYTDISLPDELMVPEKGYALFNAAGFTASFAGTLNTGPQSFNTTAVTYSSPNGGWNLVGNPYPSSIDWLAATGWTKTGVNNATYIHVNNATWAQFVGGVSTNGGSRYIAPCQGFFVQATAAGTLGMTDDIRVHNPTTFFKESDETVPNLVRLEVSGNAYKDEAVIRFLPEASAEFDGNYDAHKFYGDVAEAAQIYSLGNIPLAINTLPQANEVPVGVHAGTGGTYTIAATEINDLPIVSLEDTKTGIFTDLLSGSYTFTFEPGENEVRFLLHLGTTGISDPAKSITNIYSFKKTAFIDLKDQAKGNIFIYNVAGQLVSTRAASKGMNEVKLPNTGIYMVKVITAKSTMVKKIWIE
jgi:trimeric autotransporter adhesin